MVDYKIGELVEVIGPFDHEGDGQFDKEWKKRSFAIITDNVPRPGKNTVKIFWQGDTHTWVPTNWIKKIKNEDYGK